MQCNTTTEYYEQCGKRCEPTCKVALLTNVPCPDVCDPPACHCKFGLFRHNGKCVPVNECPLNGNIKQQFQTALLLKCVSFKSFNARKTNVQMLAVIYANCRAEKSTCQKQLVQKFAIHRNAFAKKATLVKVISRTTNVSWSLNVKPDREKIVEKINM